MIYRFVVEGGPWMLPILGASVLGLALILERAWYWLRLTASRDGNLRRRLLDGNAPPPGATVTDPIARVLVEAVRRPDDLGVASARAERILRESKSYLGLLRWTAGVSALLGLLGTAGAVRDAFHLTVDPLKQGALIANALHPTILGLSVFLGAYVASALFHGFSARLARDLDDCLDEVARAQKPIIPQAPATAGSP